ncbi:MAG: hypothetical protein LC099_01730 [Anaerolineales bacterium]|nr:hypothetical protein [Anaerolineales bacterium]
MIRKITVFLFLLGMLIPASFVFARQSEGNFEYLAIEGPGITGEIDATDPALTQDFYVFADFTQGAIPAPANPGQGYDVVRLYVDKVDEKITERPYDELTYYPYTGYVFYNGLAEGFSEYDAKWYVANPAAEKPFRKMLAQRALITWIPFAGLVVILVAFAIGYYKKPKNAE